MAQEQARELISRMKSDAAFMSRILAIKDIDERITFINGAGFNCTRLEIEQEQKDLLEVQVEGAAGGKS